MFGICKCFCVFFQERKVAGLRKKQLLCPPLSYNKKEMTYIETEIPGVWIIEPKVFEDARGYFMEAWKKEEFEQHVGKINFVQDNESCSSKGVLRGLHYQLAPYSQSKLVRVIKGTVLDVAVDLRVGSPTFGKYVSVELSGENKRQFFVPQGFAHGFHVLSDEAVFTYKVDNPYTPSHERGIRFDDPSVGVDWGITDPAVVNLSDKDRNAPLLKDAELNFTF
jgi:dTDP-4-dehydrorhamnose 3,5-epimerase